MKVAEKAGVVADEKERGEDLRQLNREVDGSFEDQKCGQKDGGGGQDAKGAADVEVAARDDALSIFFDD